MLKALCQALQSPLPDRRDAKPSDEGFPLAVTLPGAGWGPGCQLTKHKDLPLPSLPSD